MKKSVLSTFITLSMFFLLVGCGQQPSVKEKAKHPEIVFTTLANKKISLGSLKGKWVVINYWASWCKPCYKEIPALNAFAKKYKEKVEVLGVSYDHVEVDQLPAIIKKMGIEFVTLKYDPALKLGIEHVPGLPATYIINPKGKLVKTLLGEQTEKSLARNIG